MGQIKTSISIEENVSSAFKSMNTVVNSTLNTFRNFDNVINDTPTMNNKNEAILNSINSASATVTDSINAMNNSINSIDTIKSNSIETLNAITTETNNVSKSMQNLNSNINTLSNTDYWTSTIGNYNKSALEAIYTTEELVKMGFKTADALKVQEKSTEAINRNVSEVNSNVAQWNSSQNIELFNSSGIERFQEEMQSLNIMLNNLMQTQMRIQKQANKTNILPSDAINDLNNINNRIISLQSQIQKIEDNKITTIGAEQVNNQIEELRENLNNVLQIQEELNEALDNMDVSSANEAYIELENSVRDTERYIRDNTDEQGRFNSILREGSSLASGFSSKIKGVIGAYLGIQGIRKGINFISDSVNLANIQNASEVQLKTVLDNVGATENAYDKLYAKASEIQSRGIYGDEAMLGSAAEISTYISDEDAIVSMMDTLSNYAMGMSGGGEIDKSAMVDYATQLGKALDGTYDGLTKKGFVLSDAQKEIIENGTDMEKALVLDDVISQSWENLYTTMSNTPESQIIRLQNEWGDIKESIGNGVYPAILKMYSVISKNMPVIQTFANSFATGMYYVIEILTNVIDLIGAVGTFIADNWSIIEPIILGIVGALTLYYGALLIYNAIQGVSAAITTAKTFATTVHAAALAMQTGATFTATAAQYGFNAALLACPLTWIIIAIIAIIAIIYAVIAAINKVTGSSISATGVIVGVLTTAVAFVWNLFLGLLDLVLGVINAMVNPWIIFANFFANLFNDPIGSIVHLFGNMADSILGILESIAKAIDKVFGSNLAGAVQGWRSGLNGMVEKVANQYGNGSYEKVAEELNLSSDSLGLKRWDYGDAYTTGYSWGEGIEDSIGNLFSMDSLDLSSMTGLDSLTSATLADDTADTASNTGKIADSIDIAEEDLKYLRDIAEQEVVNRYTTASISIEMNNSNTINKEMDLDGIVSSLEDKIYEMSNSMAEGVHS